MHNARSEVFTAKKTTVAAVVINWNGGRLLLECLESLKRAADFLKPTQFQLIVWDNASTDGSPELASASGGVVVYKSNVNLGFGVACNRAIKKINADYIFLINPDLRIDPDAAVAAISFLTDGKNGRYGGCGVVLHDINGNRARTCARIPTFIQLLLAGLSERLGILPNHRMTDWNHRSTRDVDHVIGACLLLRKDVFLSLNGFDESYPLYLEDLDLSARIKKAGWKIRFLAVGKTVHIGGGVSQKVLGQRTALSMAARVIYSRKHFGSNKARLLDLWIRAFEIPARSLHMRLLGTQPTVSIEGCYNQALKGRLVLTSK